MQAHVVQAEIVVGARLSTVTSSMGLTLASRPGRSILTVGAAILAGFDKDSLAQAHVFALLTMAAT